MIKIKYIIVILSDLVKIVNVFLYYYDVLCTHCILYTVPNIL